MHPQVLSLEQISHFLDRGYVIVPQCFSSEIAAEWTHWAFERLKYDPKDPNTWEKQRIHLTPSKHVDVATFAPKAYAAVGDLIGGIDRAILPLIWADTFVVNLREGYDRPYQEPSAQVPGWHKDGYFFRHYLDSGEQGLLVIVAWTDVLSRGGGTFIAPDSVSVVARYLAGHPEGVPAGFFGKLIGQCHDFMELTAHAGDVILLHPFMLHAVSQNHLQIPRIISNPPVFLNTPLNLNRANSHEYSVVERGILRALGTEHYDFQPTTPREGKIPQWVLDAQQKIGAPAGY